jgi:hypothetical protein
MECEAPTTEANAITDRGEDGVPKNESLIGYLVLFCIVLYYWEYCKYCNSVLKKFSTASQHSTRQVLYSNICISLSADSVK